VVIAFVAWCGWSIVSLGWSQHPDYSAGQLRREIGWTVCTVVMFLVASRDGRSWRRLVVTIVGGFAVLAVAAVALAAQNREWDASRWHGGVGQWSTFIVLVTPLAFTLLASPPAGFGGGRRSVALAAALLVLLLVAARTTDNRMVWLALAAMFATAFALAGYRWRASLRRTPWRWLLPSACLLVVLGVLLADTMRDKALLHHPPATTVAQSLAADPRPLLWNHALERIRERPWTGFGFGRAIIGDELRTALHDPLLSHPHNLFVSQCLQTGLPGLLALVGLLAAFAASYAAAYRSSDGTRAVLGIVGLSLVVGFIVKNLTDDFFFGPNAKEFWAYSAMLLGYDARLRADATR
jgi:O-antigen ligase